MEAERKSGYLTHIQQELQAFGVKVNYTTLSEMIAEYRRIHEIPHRNRRYEMRDKHTSGEFIHLEPHVAVLRAARIWL
jgi:hypothetical protein